MNAEVCPLKSERHPGSYGLTKMAFTAKSRKMKTKWCTMKRGHHPVSCGLQKWPLM